ncbi:MAG: nucleoside-diphosphate-sugar epimerase [Methanobacterium sp. Maddingley MBC34]|nr:MAG: nucleoside-diphosphate-sugar epimerase [Methanobacterium sp. Maddingley MBC34]
MKIVIAGGAGFVGRNLVRVMLDNGFKSDEIVVIDFDPENLKFINDYVKTVEGDLSKNGQWEDELKDADYLINLAAQISSPDYEPFRLNNVQATEIILGAARDKGVKRIIHFSSAAVLSVRKDDYANTKLEGEKLVQNDELEYCILRPSLMFGPTDDKNIGYLINFAKKFPFFPIPGHGKWPRQPIYIDDICLIVISLINEFPANQSYSINGKETIYFKDMIKAVLDEVDGFHFRLFLPVSVFKFAMAFYQKISGNEEFTSDQVDSLTAEEVFPDYPWWEEFSIKPTSFQEGVRKMIEFEGNV